ncbi:protein tplate [Nicotiana attenuata]|uniref:Protein tplate n=1 Tax=Nicotiana attenuata TaxID=49451 RepID=A0A1J6JBW1_NICAT|nr:protein tplate [Nicotiana attenuata]
MAVSLFCRLSEAHPQAICALQSQYRMCAAIMELSNALIYGHRLRCGSSQVENAKIKYITLPSGPTWIKEVLNLTEIELSRVDLQVGLSGGLYFMDGSPQAVRQLRNLNSQVWLFLEPTLAAAAAN